MRPGVMLLTVVLFGAATCGAQTIPTRAISVDEAHALIRLVLRHEHAHFLSRFCEIEHLDKPDKSFVPDYYSFGAHCDFPNTAASSPFGLFVVSPRTGDIFDFNACKWYSFPAIRRAQKKIKERIRTTDADEQRYRDQTGCWQKDALGRTIR